MAKGVRKKVLNASMRPTLVSRVGLAQPPLASKVPLLRRSRFMAGMKKRKEKPKTHPLTPRVGHPT